MNQALAIPRTRAVLLNWCAEADSVACIASLLADATPGLEVLIADNASPDGSGARVAAHFPALAYLQTGENLGYAGGNLRAMEWAFAQEYDCVLIINDYAAARPGCVSGLLAALAANPKAAACAPTIVHGPPHEQIVWWTGGRFVPYKALGVHHQRGDPLASVKKGDGSPEPATFLSGCVVLFRASALRVCGGFRAEFFAYVKDVELGLRFMRAGWTLLWVRQALAVHKVAYPAPPASAWARGHRDRNRRRVAPLHFGWWERAVLTAWYWPTRVGRWVGGAVAARLVNTQDYVLAMTRPACRSRAMSFTKSSKASVHCLPCGVATEPP